MSSGRQTKTIEFTPPDEAAVAHELHGLRMAGGGWVNLMPGIRLIQPPPADRSPRSS